MFVTGFANICTIKSIQVFIKYSISQNEQRYFHFLIEPILFLLFVH